MATVSQKLEIILLSSLSYISECQQANSSCDACVKVGKVQVISCLTFMVI